MSRCALFLSANKDHEHQLCDMLHVLEIELTRVASFRQLAQAIRTHSPGVVLVDASEPGDSWRAALDQVRKNSPAAQALITTSHLDVHFWTDALEAGAYDILTQPFHAVEVERLFASAWLKHESAKIPPAKTLTRLRAATAVG